MNYTFKYSLREVGWKTENKLSLQFVPIQNSTSKTTMLHASMVVSCMVRTQTWFPSLETSRDLSKNAVVSCAVSPGVTYRVCSAFHFHFTFVILVSVPIWTELIFVVPLHQKTGFECFWKVLGCRNVSAVFVLVGVSGTGRYWSRILNVGAWDIEGQTWTWYPIYDQHFQKMHS